MKRRNFLKDVTRWLLFGGLLEGVVGLAMRNQPNACIAENGTCRNCPMMNTQRCSQAMPLKETVE